MHVASPVAFSHKDKEHTLKSAIQGTRNVLMSCFNNKITKIVVTSSVAAVHCSNPKSYITAEEWTEENCGHPYDEAKVGAEREVWKIAKEKNLNISTINPSVIIGENLLSRIAPS